MLALRSRFAFAILAATLALPACGGDEGNQGLEINPDDNRDTGGSDTGGSDAGTSDAGDTSADATTDAGEERPPEAEFFWSCEGDTDCDADAICVEHVCVVPPRAAASLAEDWEEVFEEDGELVTIGYVEDRPDAEFELGCYADDSLFSPVDAPEAATLHGQVDLFGSGTRTSGLCVSAWREEALLPWLIESPCFDLEGDDDAFVACFQLDPCRCDQAFGDGFPDDAIEDMIDAMAEARDTTIDSVDTCYAAIGFCDAVGDDDLRASCASDVGAVAEGFSSVGLGHTVSVENPDNPEAALFEIPNVPTNLRLAYKVSGVENRWIDTWEYGLFTRGDLVRDGRMRIDTNAVGAGTWRTIPPAAGFPGGIDAVNGAVAGAVRDCGNSERAPLNVVHATAGFSFTAPDTRIVYFNGNPNDRLPANGRIDSNVLGLFAAINLPAGPNRVAAAICTENCVPGDPANTGDPAYTLAGARNVFQTPKSIIIATFEGARVGAE